MSGGRRPLRVLLAGFAGLGTQNHQQELYAPSIQGSAEWQIVGSCRLDPAERPAHSVPALAGLPEFDDLEVAIGRLDADVACVCGALAARSAGIAQALSAGAHVLADKPLGASADDTRVAVATARSAERVLVGGYHHRLHPDLDAARTAVARGDVGQIVHIRAEFLVPRGDLVPEGEILNFAGYPVDVIRSFIGRSAESVQVVAGRRWNDPPPAAIDGPPDLATVHITYDGGISGSVTVGRHRSAGGFRRIHRYRIDGTEGTVTVDLCRPAILIGSAAEPNGAGTSASTGTAGNTVSRLWSRLHRTITQKAPVSHTGADLVHVAEVLDGARTSIATGLAAVISTPRLPARPN